MSDVKIDLMANGQAQGEFIAKVGTKLDPRLMRPFVDEEDGKSYYSVYSAQDKDYKNILANSNTGTLRRDEWKLLDEAVIGVAEKRLQGFNDLVSRGLVYNLGNAMGTTVLEHHTVSDMLSAQMDMDGIIRGENDAPNWAFHYLPIPIIHVDYTINLRVLETSRNMGNAIDTTMAERAARRVAEFTEDLLFTNKQYAYGGGTIYSLINFPHRIQHSLGTAWTSLSANSSDGSVGDQIVSQILKMKQELINAHQYGPYIIYIPTGYETLIDSDYNTYKTKTIRQRILEISNLVDIKVVDTLPANNVIMLQLSSETVRIVRGMGLTNVQWGVEGGFATNFKVFTIQVPQIRADWNNKCGVLHASV